MTATRRLRREPPAFRHVEVRRVERLTPRMVRVTLGGAELAGFTVEQPAASVRVLLPTPGGGRSRGPELERQRVPPARRDVARRSARSRRGGVDPDALELDVGIVVHGGGVASDWALSAEPGESAAISGPGRGYTVDADAPAYLVAGDETAIPAITQVLDAVPDADARAGARRSRPLRRPPRAAGASRRDRRVVRSRSPGRLRATRSAPPCATWSSRTAPGCGRPAKPPPCSASAAISSTTAACRARRPRCAATGSTAAPATETTTRDSRRSSRLSVRRISAELREGEVVKPLELFFDLVFVLAFTQCTALMAAQPTWEGIGRGMLVLAMLWWAWVGYAWLTSVIEPEEGAVRIVMFAATGRAARRRSLRAGGVRRPRAPVRDRVRDGARRADRALPDRESRRPRAPPLGRQLWRSALRSGSGC